ncbi:MAG: hypothetical protein JST91_11165 [Actinobacteria bacterium]|nr:hypothetical protein [Actinomycetota bacterium]
MWSKSGRVAAAILAAAYLGTAGVASAQPAPSPTPAPDPGPAPTAAPAPPAGVTLPGDGTYTVGTDIQPGTYTSAGPVGDSACYWKRVNGADIVDNAMTKKPQTVQIEPTDTSFVTSSCQPWQQADCSAGCPPAGPNPMDVLGGLRDFVFSRPLTPPPG